MSEYQLEVKQIVQYPRCRIYRQFVQTLIHDRSIRSSGGSGLFYYTILCSHVNFRTTYRCIRCWHYTVHPGEWVCTLRELCAMLRVTQHKQALAVLDYLQAEGLLQYEVQGGAVKYKICDWCSFNCPLRGHAPCQKKTGFFFLPVAAVRKLVNAGRCSEMDMLLDLWVHTVYNDPNIQGSDLGPVVYLRDGSGSPLLNYSALAARWGVSRATVCRVLKKLEDAGHLSVLSFPGRQGSVIYLWNYLSTMFQISDVIIEKQVMAAALHIEIRLESPDAGTEAVVDSPGENSGETSVSTQELCVSKSQVEFLLEQVAQTLLQHGFAVPSTLPGAHWLSYGWRKYHLDYSRVPIGKPFSLELCCAGQPLLRLEAVLKPKFAPKKAVAKNLH